jgi:phage FluMu gp28-like protein
MVDDVPVIRLALPEDFSQQSKAERERFVEEWCEENLADILADLNPREPHYFGEDFGRVCDLTIIALLALLQNLVRRARLVIELRRVPFEQQRQILFYVLDRTPRLSGGACDATGNGGYLAEVAAQRYGESRAQNIRITEPFYAEHLPPFKASFEDGTIEIARDLDHLNDLRQFQVVKGMPTLAKAHTQSTTAPGEERHGDAAIAYLMAHYATTCEAEVFDYRRVASGIAADEQWTEGLSWRGDGYRRPRRDEKLTRRVRATAGIKSLPGGVL